MRLEIELGACGKNPRDYTEAAFFLLGLVESPHGLISGSAILVVCFVCSVNDYRNVDA